MAPDLVFAVYSFEAECADELSFAGGERIIVLERDEQYGDGWWQGRNERGEVGLFPQSYTSPQAPELTGVIPSGPSTTVIPSNTIAEVNEDGPDAGPVAAHESSLSPAPPLSVANGVPATPVMAATMSDVDSALRDHLNGSTEPAASLRSRADSQPVPGDDDEPTDSMPVDRSTLAANARNALAQDAERKRLEAEQLRTAPPVDGLEMSDESGDEDDGPALASAPFARSTAGSGLTGVAAPMALPTTTKSPFASSQRSIAALGARSAPRSSSQPQIAQEDDEDEAPRSFVPEDPEPELRSTAYFSQTTSPAFASTSPAFATPSAHTPASERELMLPGAVPANAAAVPLPDTPQGETFPSKTSNPSLRTAAVAAAGAAVAGVGAAVAAVMPSVQTPPTAPSVSPPAQGVPARTKRERQASLNSLNGVGTPAATSPIPPLPTVTSVSRPDGIRRTSSDRPPMARASSSTDRPILPRSASGSSKRSLLSGSTSITAGTERPDTPPVLAGQAAQAQPILQSVPPAPMAAQTQPAEPSPTSRSFSSSSRPSSASRLDSGATSAMPTTSVTSIDRSPHSSLGTSQRRAPAAPPVELSARPVDPREWAVDDVVSWGRGRGYDAGTLAKFQEHEISGDVLLEMDVNTLKEIDLHAFGRRVQVFNGIKELRRLAEQVSLGTSHQPPPQSLHAPSGQSPTFSGYEPDTPSSRAFSPRDSFSPSVGGVYSARDSSGSAAQSSIVNAPYEGARTSGVAGTFGDRRGSDNSHTLSIPPRTSSDMDHPRGLGLDGSEQAALAAAGAGAIGGIAAAGMARAATEQSARPQTGASKKSSHSRSQTVGSLDTYGTARGTSLHDLNEEVDTSLGQSVASDADADARSDAPRARKGVFSRIRQQTAGSLSRGSRSAMSDGEAGLATVGADTPPSSPEHSRRSSIMSRSTTKPEKSSSGAAQFFSGRARKAPPRVTQSILGLPSASTSESGPGGAKSSTSSRRSTRLFAFGVAPSSPKQDASADMKSTIGAPLEAGPPMNDGSPTSTPGPTPKTSMAPPPTVADDEPTRALDAVTQIGEPDLKGWLYKKGDGLNAWKMRYVMLKGTHLYWLKTPTERKVKGWIDLLGYKVVTDGDTSRGRYGFKLIHSGFGPAGKPPHFFSSDDSLEVRRWMKHLMKQTISRDYSIPVTSSCNIQTIPLAEAQAMFPPPRPPSPQSRARAQQARLASANPNSLTPKDAAVLMSMQKPDKSPTSANGAAAPPAKSAARSASGKRGSIAPSFLSTNNTSAEPSPTRPAFDRKASSQSLRADTITANGANRDAELLDWVNANLPPSVPPATSFGTSFKSGRIVLRLVESLSGQNKGIDDSRFGSNVARADDDDDAHIDVMLDIFDLFLDLDVPTEDVSIGEIMRGDEPQTTKLVTSIRSRFTV